MNSGVIPSLLNFAVINEEIKAILYVLELPDEILERLFILRTRLLNDLVQPIKHILRILLALGNCLVWISVTIEFLFEERSE